MAKRYEYTRVSRNKFGDQVYKTTMYPTIRKRMMIYLFVQR